MDLGFLCSPRGKKINSVTPPLLEECGLCLGLDRHKRGGVGKHTWPTKKTFPRETHTSEIRSNKHGVLQILCDCKQQ